VSVCIYYTIEQMIKVTRYNSFIQVISAAHMEETIRRLRRRITVRLSLHKQLTSLEQCSVPVLAQFPAKISSKLSKWARTTREDFEACAYAQGIVALGLSSPSCLYFSGAIERGSASLLFQVSFTTIYLLKKYFAIYLFIYLFIYYYFHK